MKTHTGVPDGGSDASASAWTPPVLAADGEASSSGARAASPPGDNGGGLGDGDGGGGEGGGGGGGEGGGGDGASHGDSETMLETTCATPSFASVVQPANFALHAAGVHPLAGIGNWRSGASSHGACAQHEQSHASCSDPAAQRTGAAGGGGGAGAGQASMRKWPAYTSPPSPLPGHEPFLPKCKRHTASVHACAGSPTFEYVCVL